MPEQRPPIDKTKSMFFISRFRILLTVDDAVIPAIIETIFFVGILFAILFPKPGIFFNNFFYTINSFRRIFTDKSYKRRQRSFYFAF